MRALPRIDVCRHSGAAPHSFVLAGLSAAARPKHASFGETRRSLGEGGRPCATEAPLPDLTK